LLILIMFVPGATRLLKSVTWQTKNTVGSVKRVSLNLFIASGYLGNDIEIRYTPNGKCIGQFSLPVTNGYGEHEKTSWLRCKLLGDRAEKLAPFLLKGSKITVSGSFVLEEWEKDGVKNSMPCIIIDNIDLPPKSDNNMPKPAPTTSKPLTQEELDELDDKIPF